MGDRIPTAKSDGTVACLDLYGKPVTGVNSNVLASEGEWGLAAEWRNRLIGKYPNVLKS
jgi:hypothetical protein